MKVVKALPHGRLVITATLTKLGGQDPYFSITAEEYDNRALREGGGCMHERIREVCGDQYDDLIAAHLSSIDGMPMHAAANGFYWAAGALGGLNARYHGGDGNSAKSADECARIFAEHIRLPRPEADAVLAQVKQAYDSVGQYSRVYTDAGTKAAQAFFQDWVAQKTSLWKQQADALIAKYDLTITTR